MLAGVEPMSEPRDKVVPQAAVRQFYEGVCGAIASVDSHMPCVVGPTPYYKVWQLNSSMLLRTAGGRPMENVICDVPAIEYTQDQAVATAALPRPYGGCHIVTAAPSLLRLCAVAAVAVWCDACCCMCCMAHACRVRRHVRLL